MKSKNPKLKNREKIISLIKEGVSIPKISKQLQIGKSTVYYHYKKIKGRKIPLAKIPKDYKVIGEFLGAFAGDGSYKIDKKYSHYSIRFHLHRYDDKQYAEYLQKLIGLHFNRRPSIYYIEPNASVVKFRSKLVFKLIEEYLILHPSKSLNVCLKKPISSFSDEFLSYFVRGLVDTDGSVDKHGRITLGLITKNLINQVSEILTKFEINHRISIRKRKPKWNDLYLISINQAPAKIYLKKIGFSNKRKDKRVR